MDNDDALDLLLPAQQTLRSPAVKWIRQSSYLNLARGLTEREFRLIVRIKLDPEFVKNQWFFQLNLCIQYFSNQLIIYSVVYFYLFIIAP